MEDLTYWEWQSQWLADPSLCDPRLMVSLPPRLPCRAPVSQHTQGERKLSYSDCSLQKSVFTPSTEQEQSLPTLWNPRCWVIDLLKWLQISKPLIQTLLAAAYSEVYFHKLNTLGTPSNPVSCSLPSMRSLQGDF